MRSPGRKPEFVLHQNKWMVFPGFHTHEFQIYQSLFDVNLLVGKLLLNKKEFSPIAENTKQIIYASPK